MTSLTLVAGTSALTGVLVDGIAPWAVILATSVLMWRVYIEDEFDRALLVAWHTARLELVWSNLKGYPIHRADTSKTLSWTTASSYSTARRR